MPFRPLYAAQFPYWGVAVAKKDQELRPVMTRIPEGLRRRLERQAKWHRRSMNAEIVARLQQSFDLPDQAQEIADAVSAEFDTFSIESDLDKIQSQIRAILSHLGLPDPVEEAKAREAEARARRAEARKAGRPEAGPSVPTGEKK